MEKALGITLEKEASADALCPFCGAKTIQEKCKVICRSEICVFRVVYNCSEF